MKLKNAFTLLLLFLCVSVFSQNWTSLDSLSGDSDVVVCNFEVSNSRAIYINGYARNNTTFKNHVFNNGNRYTNFIAKLDENLNLIWLKEMPTTTQNMNKLVLDGSGNIYYVFYTINNCVVSGNNIDYRKGENIIARLDSNGSVLRVYNFGDRFLGGVGGYNASSYGISVKNKNFISISFTYNDTAYLANDTLYAPMPNIENYAVLNIDSNLNEISHFTVPVSISNIKHSYNGAIYIVGQYIHTGVFNWNNLNLPSSCSSTGYLAKLDSLGNPTWVKYINAVDTCANGQIAYGASFEDLAFENNNVYSTGFYMGNSDYSGTILNHTSTYGFGLNYFFTKIDYWGNISWCKTLNSPNGSFGRSLVVDSCGNASVLGTFNIPTASSGSYSLTQQYQSYQEPSLVVIDYDYNGNTTNMLMGESHLSNYYIKSMYGYPHKNYVIGNCEWYVSHFSNLSLPSANNYNMVFMASYTPAYGNCNTTEILNYKTGNNFNLFPVPCNNEITVNSERNQENEMFQIVDVLGNIIETGSIQSNKAIINTIGFANGVYFLKITDAKDLLFSSKIIVAH